MIIGIIESSCIICSCHNARKNGDNRSRVSILFIVDSGPVHSQPLEVTALLIFSFFFFGGGPTNLFEISNDSHTQKVSVANVRSL